jgi:hypothetical protein
MEGDAAGGLAGSLGGDFVPVAAQVLICLN